MRAGVVPVAPAGAAGTAARVRATSLVAASSAVLLIAGVARSRVLATAAGPEGFGLAGILQSALVAGATLGAFGLSVTGVRLVASARDRGPEAVAAARRTLLTLAWAGGLAAAALLLVMGARAGTLFTGRALGSTALAVIAAGVLAQTLAQAQSSWLAGHQRIDFLTAGSIWGAVMGATVAVAALWVAGAGAIPVAVVAPVAAELLALTWFARRVVAAPMVAAPEAAAPVVAASEAAAPEAIGARMRETLRLGAAVTAAGLVTALGQLAARGALRAETGLAGVGNFQAAWTISMSYLGIVFSSMALDYYPRLARAAGNAEAGREVNAQTRFALRLAAPLLLGAMAAAPLAVRWLFAAGFTDAPAILRWQLVGDVFKIPGWALGFVLLARGAGASFLIAESGWTAAYLIVIVGGVGTWGPTAAGVAFCAAGIVHLALVRGMTGRLIGFAWEGETRTLFFAVLASALFSLALAHAGRGGIAAQAALAVAAATLCWPSLVRPFLARRPEASAA